MVELELDNAKVKVDVSNWCHDVTDIEQGQK